MDRIYLLHLPLSVQRDIKQENTRPLAGRSLLCFTVFYLFIGMCERCLSAQGRLRLGMQYACGFCAQATASPLSSLCVNEWKCRSCAHFHGRASEVEPFGGWSCSCKCRNTIGKTSTTTTTFTFVNKCVIVKWGLCISRANAGRKFSCSWAHLKGLSVDQFHSLPSNEGHIKGQCQFPVNSNSHQESPRLLSSFHPSFPQPPPPPLLPLRPSLKGALYSTT